MIIVMKWNPINLTLNIRTKFTNMDISQNPQNLTEILGQKVQEHVKQYHILVYKYFSICGGSIKCKTRDNKKPNLWWWLPLRREGEKGTEGRALNNLFHFLKKKVKLKPIPYIISQFYKSGWNVYGYQLILKYFINISLKQLLHHHSLCLISHK